jgi:molybdopterin synthase catalytic subunit
VDEDSSSRSLDDIGAVTVLEAMVEQRRRGSSVPALETDDADAIATQRRERIAPNDDVFQKIR